MRGIWRGSADKTRSYCNEHDMEEGAEDLQEDYPTGIAEGKKRQCLIQDVLDQEDQLGNGTENLILVATQKLVDQSQ